MSGKWIRADVPFPSKKTVWEEFKFHFYFFKYSVSRWTLFFIPGKYWPLWLKMWGQGEFYFDVTDEENNDGGTIFRIDEDQD